LLGLWRGYCRPRDGYAIAFDRETLQRIVKRRGSRLECVVYSPAAQWDLLNSVEMSAVRQSGLDAKPREFAKAYAKNFLWLAPFLKSPKFFEEGEWRIVPGPKPGKIRYRHRGKKRIPYVLIPLDDRRGKLPIKSILIGPQPRRGQDERAVEDLCASLGIRAN